MKTLNTVIAENNLNENSLKEIREIVIEVSEEKGLKVIVNHQGANFWSSNPLEEELVLEAKEEIMIQLRNMGY